MRYYIADLHFFHENLNTKWINCGFANVNAELLYAENSGIVKCVIGMKLFLLGDLSWGKYEENKPVASEN